MGERSSGWFPEPTSWAAGAYLTKSQMDSSGQVPSGHVGLPQVLLWAIVLILKESQKIQNDREYLWVYLGIEYTQLY